VTQENPTAATPPARRRPRASVGGFALKLDAPSRPGFVRRFVNGDPSRIMKMEELGYTLVSDPAGEGKSRTDGKGTRITRHAGKLEDGAPMQAVLMETPEEEFAYGLSDKEEHRQQFEDTIRRSGDPTGQVDGAYVPKGQSTLTRSG
jgi:hypothetical protein